MTDPLQTRCYTYTYDGLYVCSLTPEKRDRTLKYAYVVTGRLPHTAFRTRAAFLQWLKLRGLQLAEELPPDDEHGVRSIIGAYRESTHLDYAEFYAHAANAVHTRKLSNMQFTLGLITTDADGLRTVHTLNPYCAQRPVFDYQESLALEDRGGEALGEPYAEERTQALAASLSQPMSVSPTCRRGSNGVTHSVNVSTPAPTLFEAVQKAEVALGENLVWLTDQLELSVRQKDPETLRRLAQLDEAWRFLCCATAAAKLPSRALA